MAEAVVRYGKDTWAGSGAPAVNHNDANRIKVKSGEVYGFLHAKTPVPPGLTVVSAILTVYAAKTADWTGSKTVTLKRLAERVPFGKLTWNNKPGVTGAAVDVTVSGAVDGQALEFDVTAHLQTVANGDPHYGWRLTTNSTTAHRVYGFDSDHPPILTVEYAVSPSQPVDLLPSDGAVSMQFPVFQFDAVDLENPQDMTDLQIQIDAAGDFTTGIDFDSGWVPASVPEWEPAGSAWAGIADGATKYWRVRYRNGAIVGDWSDPVSFSRANKGTVTITNPAADPNDYVTDHTPPFIHSFSGTQVAWRKWITPADDHTEIIANSRKTDGTDTSWTPPKHKLRDDKTYTLHVRVWDNVVRVPGDEYAHATRDFTVVDGPETAPVLASVDQDGGTPFVTLTWTRGTAPDSWTVLRDGDPIETGIDPADTLTTGTTHQWVDVTAAPRVQHTYKVRAVVNGSQSPKSNGVTITTNPKGVWLLDYDRERYVHISGTGVESWRRTDRVGVYELANGGFVQVYAGSNGVAGAFPGVLNPVEGRTVAQWRDDFDWMAARPNRTFHLIAADLCIPVKIRNASATPHPDSTLQRPKDVAYFDFFQDLDA